MGIKSKGKQELTQLIEEIKESTLDEKEKQRLIRLLLQLDDIKRTVDRIDVISEAISYNQEG